MAEIGFKVHLPEDEFPFYALVKAQGVEVPVTHKGHKIGTGRVVAGSTAGGFTTIEFVGELDIKIEGLLDRVSVGGSLS